MPEAVFMMGLPAAGKSTYVARHADEFIHFTHIDPDAFAVQHPLFDNANPGPAHEATKQAVRLFLNQTIREEVSFVLDSTSWNAERLFERIAEVRSRGYKVTLVYVKVPLEVALARNQKRARHVPEEKVVEVARHVQATFDAISRVVDEVRVVDNSKEE